jgi:hypothetical protein
MFIDELLVQHHQHRQHLFHLSFLFLHWDLHLHLVLAMVDE